MARSQIEKADALSIAGKIGAVVKADGKHQKAIFYHEGRLILVFGIRHGRKARHGFLAGENGPLKLNETKALALARCTLTKEQYIQILREKGFIQA